MSGHEDELLWAAMWLYKATDNHQYLSYVIDNADSFGGVGWSITEFSWDVKFAGIQVLASQVRTSVAFFGPLAHQHLSIVLHFFDDYDVDFTVVYY